MQIVYVANFYNNDIEEYLSLHQLIYDATYISQDNIALIALRLKPMYLQSDVKLLMDEIKEYVLSKENVDEVIITQDADLFYKAKNCSTQQDKINLIKIAWSRYEYNRNN